jgi:uncharacterized protein
MVAVLQPLGVKCNIRCTYCFQNPERDSGNDLHSYDLERMKEGIEREGGPFLMFGGEPLMMPLRDLEALWSWGLEKYGCNILQTNAVLITDEHIDLFKKYKVNVGVSVDGPGEFNDFRWAGSLKRTREATARAHQAIEVLCKEGVVPGLIVTLHQGNATADRLPAMHEWVRRLERLGIISMRLHILEIEDDHIRRTNGLSIEENLAAFLSFLTLEQELSTLRFDVFGDMRSLLLGQDRDATCIWSACDPYTTEAVRGVNGHGQRSNCNQVNKDGVGFVKSDVEGFERYLALHQTPQEHGGCAGCRFFLMCKGQCPGNAIDGDWRNRSEYCEVWKRLYEHIEGQMLAKGLAPVSTRPIRERLEGALHDLWSTGTNSTMAALLESMGQVAALDVPCDESINT